MDLSISFVSIRMNLSFCHRTRHGVIRNSSSQERRGLSVSKNLQKETEKTLEWNSVCLRLSEFTSTSMGFRLARSGNIPIGRDRRESQKLLNQTTEAIELSEPLDFSGIEDLTEIVNGAVNGELVTIGQLCVVQKTLHSVQRVFKQLVRTSYDKGNSSDQCSSILAILQKCDFLTELEQKIGFCIDSDLSIILDRASEKLGFIRSERRNNMGKLESLLKVISSRIFSAGGIDNPLVTKRRSRMCVGIRASHRSLLPSGIILDVSSSGATYFMEPREVIELNNMEVRLSSIEKEEELIILSLLSSEIASLELAITSLMEKVTELDLALARASYAQWMRGVCPILTEHVTEQLLSIDIDGIQHPLLLESSLEHSTPDQGPKEWISMNGTKGEMKREILSENRTTFPVPLDIKIKKSTKVVIISGPNTGGKTATMKTLGLASLMSKAGMYLPAKNSPKIPWFDQILADIGDHQSLEHNLSTFSGHISRLCKILEVASEESLVLIDEIGNGTDPSEGVALSSSILQYLKDRVKLALVTTHYSDLTFLKEKDDRFENAAMEFSMDTLKPTYRVLWGSTVDSNALNIAKLIGFNQKVLDRAREWVEKLMPSEQSARQGFLYQSLLAERNTLEKQANKSASILSEVVNLHQEILSEAEDLDKREIALKAKFRKQIHEELKVGKSQIDAIVKNFENQLKVANSDQFKSLIKEAESSIASIVESHSFNDDSSQNESEIKSFMPQIGEQVYLKGLGGKLATILEIPEDDGMILIQYGKMKMRVKKNDMKPISKGPKNTKGSIPSSKFQVQRRSIKSDSVNEDKGPPVSFGPVVQTSRNTVDLRGMRVEEASQHLNMALSSCSPYGVLFIIHGMGTGVIKEKALKILSNHPRVDRFEQESPTNYGCTIAFIK